MTAYYNEHEPYAAQWLRNLIAAGHIAAGDVDARDIQDVTPDDLTGYTQCHFFAGVGGWSYALRLAGWPDDRPVWTGSCPCQPLSSAGQRKGAADERHLWPAFFRLIIQRIASHAVAVTLDGCGAEGAFVSAVENDDWRVLHGDVLDALEALADNVESLSDEEVLTEVREEGRSPEDIAEWTRSQLQNAVRKFKRR